ncbi:hypothetical protein ACKI2D_31105 [Streptomyces europaeiscabiei]|uniref:hypothetical protein n=1 Tax=Streptomyces europaeiscabiei TaxID=146819 RepID=UPI0038F74035
MRRGARARLGRRGARRVRRGGARQYRYDDEQIYAEYEFDVNADGTVTFGISYVKFDDVVTMLNALGRALSEQRQD